MSLRHHCTFGSYLYYDFLQVSIGSTISRPISSSADLEYKKGMKEVRYSEVSEALLLPQSVSCDKKVGTHCGDNTHV